MKTITLTQGKVAIVDDADYESLSAYSWHAHFNKGKWYARRNEGKFPFRKTVRMHQAIANTPNGMDTDHINGDTLDNRRSNLRTCTHSENLRNRGPQANNTSGFKGVTWYPPSQKWAARIKHGNKRMHLGYFEQIEDAARAYDNAARDIYGEFAKLNFE